MKQALALLRAAAISAFILPVAGGALTAGADVRSASSVEGVFAIGIPGGEPEEPTRQAAQLPAGPAPADVQRVWDMSASGEWTQAAGFLRALETAHPAWQAPTRLKTHIAGGLRETQVREALARQDWPGVLSALGPARPDRCEAPFSLWARADALEGLKDTAALTDLLAGALAQCEDPALVAALMGRAGGVLEADGLDRLLAADAFDSRAEPEITAAYEALVRQARAKHFEAALAAGDLAVAARLAEASGEARLLAGAGWKLLDMDAAYSATLFEQALAQEDAFEARRGLVLAALQAEDLDKAQQALAGAPDSAPLASLSGRVKLARAKQQRIAGNREAALGLAREAAALNPDLAAEASAEIGGALLDAANLQYAAGAYADARRLASDAAGYVPTKRAGRMRAAWSDLQLGDSQSAATTFSQLYLEASDTESAEGFALAASKSGQLDTAAAIARAIGGPLGPLVESQYAEVAFNEGDYLLARQYAPEAYTQTDGLDHAWVRQAVFGRSQGGTRGENRLRGLVSTTSAGLVHKRNRFEAGITVYSIDPDSSANPAVRASRETFTAPYLAWHREGRTAFGARIGLSPIGGAADARVIGEVAMARQQGPLSVEARIFARPKTDSVLALAGQKDAATGQAFGRVTETGAMVRGRAQVGKIHSVQADIEVTDLQGEATAGNSKVGLGLAASRTIAREGFAYIATGPFYQYQSYDRNTNFFTLGHGGYFSPQDFHRAGWSLNAQTQPLKAWIVKADAAIAYESVEEDPARLRPLEADPSPLVGGSSSTGLAGALEITAARRIGREIVLSGSVSGIVSQAYEDVRVGIALTWVPAGRAGLVRSDLPSDPFTPATWTLP